MKKYYYVPCEVTFVQSSKTQSSLGFITIKTDKAMFPIIDAQKKAEKELGGSKIILLNPTEISEEDYLAYPVA